MNKSKAKFAPIDQQTFQQHIKTALLMHASGLLIFFGYSYFGNPDHSEPLIYIAASFYFFLMILLYRYNHPVARFKAIYKGEELKTPILMGMMFFPPVIIAFTCLLYFKNKSLTPAPKIFTHYGYFSLLILPFCALSIMNPQTAFWSAGPSVYYVIDLTHDSQKLFDITEAKKSAKESVYKYYVETKSDKASDMEIMILAGLSANELGKRRKAEAEVAGADKDLIMQKYGKLMIHDLSDALVKIENSKLEVTDYSPIQWINPASVFEILLITSVNEAVKKKMVMGMAQAGVDMVGAIEKQISKTPADKKAGYESVLKIAKSDFSKSRKYRSIASEK